MDGTRQVWEKRLGDTQRDSRSPSEGIVGM
jgi:hypothetical protein